MPGQILRCDHDGCDAVFPPTPVRGRHWPIREEAEKAGWISSRAGLYSLYDPAGAVQDFCPDHVDDLAEVP